MTSCPDPCTSPGVCPYGVHVTRAPLVQETVLLDPERPCLSCGAPWRSTVELVEDLWGTVAARASVGTCSAHCWDRDFDGFVNGLAERVDRDWIAWV